MLSCNAFHSLYTIIVHYTAFALELTHKELTLSYYYHVRVLNNNCCQIRSACPVVGNAKSDYFINLRHIQFYHCSVPVYDVILIYYSYIRNAVLSRQFAQPFVTTTVANEIETLIY